MTTIYDLYPNEYDSIVSPVNALYDPLFIKNISPMRGSVLDVGCGTGRLLAKLAPFFRKSYGLDTSKELGEIAKKHCHKSTIVFGDACRLPYPSRSFDYVTSQNVLHLTRRPKAIREMIRVLKPRGRLTITEVVSLRNGLRKWWEKIYYRELRRTLPLIINYGLWETMKIHDYIYSDLWQGYMEEEKPNRLSRDEFIEYYARILPGAKLGTINYLIDYAIWDKN